MEMPKWNELLGETLKAYADGEPRSLRTVKIEVADKIGLPDDLRNELTPATKANKIEDRVGWAFYVGLKKAKYVEEVSRGQYRISELGKAVLLETNGCFDEQWMINNSEDYRFYLEKRKAKTAKRSKQDSKTLESATPEDLIGEAVKMITEALQADLLNKLYNMDPYKFEEVVADLLQAMGYGESKVTKKSNDGGVDAIVNEDTLGLNKIFAQAKRYSESNIVQKKAIRDFLGSLAEHKVTKGVVITTSGFSNDAKMLAESNAIRLIDGDELTQLMIENGIGVSKGKAYYLSKVDTDYFVDES